jgi:hypothetical protein
MGVHNLVPDNLDNCLSYSVVAYLKKLKNNAKVEYEKMVSSVGQRAPGTVIDGVKVNARSVLKNLLSLVLRSYNVGFGVYINKIAVICGSYFFIFSRKILFFTI